MAASILVVDDEKNAREGLAQALEVTFGDDVHIELAEDGVEALKKISESSFDLIIADIRMPHMDGMELLKRIREKGLLLDVLILTGHGTIEMAVEAMRVGAVDYLQKPVNLDELELVVRRIFEQKRLLSENEYLRTRLREKDGYRELIGSSPEMKKVFEKIQQIAGTKATVLITGESGTGKELVAEAIHHLSPRKDEPMIKVNCSALNENLLESELFGHERGAFTGAVRQRKGRFELADRGTIFLDEIGELTPDIQVKLLRILEEREFERVGGNRTIRVNVRLLFATNADLEQKVRDGTFREDFYFRLKVVTLHIPPLRERRADIAPLLDYFNHMFSQENAMLPVEFTREALDLLEHHDWPGNVREVRNLVEHLVLMKPGQEIGAADLRDFIPSAREQEEMSLSLDMKLADVEREYILRVLDQHNGNRTHAAEALGIGRRTLIRKLNEFGLGESDS